MTSTPLPSPGDLKRRSPLSAMAKQAVAQFRETVSRIVRGEDLRKALVIGPCSVHDRASAIEYAGHFRELAKAVEKTCFLVMRVYVEKPRTKTGWKGLLYDPHLDGSHDMATGLLWTRELLLELAEMGIPTAVEFVDPLAALYFEDLVAWGFIGARTSASQPHRQFASARAMPIGFKNSTDGNLESAVHGVLSAKSPHTLLQIDEEGRLGMQQSEGNRDCHIVLRGANDFANYDPDSISAALQLLKKSHLPQRLMIDCSHGNCQKDFRKQYEVFQSILQQGNEAVFGLMLESHLESGNQPLGEDPSLLKYAVSITDPCLDWKTTSELVYCADAAFSSAGVS